MIDAKLGQRASRLGVLLLTIAAILVSIAGCGESDPPSNVQTSGPADASDESLVPTEPTGTTDADADDDSFEFERSYVTEWELDLSNDPDGNTLNGDTYRTDVEIGSLMPALNENLSPFYQRLLAECSQEDERAAAFPYYLRVENTSSNKLPVRFTVLEEPREGWASSESAVERILVASGYEAGVECGNSLDATWFDGIEPGETGGTAFLIVLPDFYTPEHPDGTLSDWNLYPAPKLEVEDSTSQWLDLSPISCKVSDEDDGEGASRPEEVTNLFEVGILPEDPPNAEESPGGC